ncbi:hypothetical protein [Pseudomonas gingeri]|uniref:Delta-60 repeat domain-containing protein n=1 Tax=Pseudomonas gingeri TaxID=117681 RepID=A0A7Y7WPY8_9PSED|nr:hypothetical protein [Pseudomonas gingeri]NWB85403.1 hypothetical protein [Pseudomonas gingeri]
MSIAGLRPRGEILFVGTHLENNQLSFQLAQLTNLGRLDPSFGPDGTGSLLGVFKTGSEATATGAQILKDGKILLAGHHRSFAGESRIALARFLENGAPDESFGNKGSVILPRLTDAPPNLPQDHLSTLRNRRTLLSHPRSNIVVDPDEKIIIGQNALLLRLEKNGEIDHSFNQTGHLNPNTVINAVAVSADRKITIAGVDSEGANLARFNVDGSPDLDFGHGGRTSFGVGYPSAAISLSLHDDGRIFATGVSDMDPGDIWGAGLRGLLAAFTANGRLDPAFNNGAPLVSDFGITDGMGWFDIGGTPDEIVVVGYAGLLSRESGLIARYLANGNLDTTFGNGSGYVRRFFPGSRGVWESVIVQPDKGIVVTGDTPRNVVSRYLGT